MLTVKYIVYILFYLNTIVFGHNSLKLNSSLGNHENVNLGSLLELHKDLSAERNLNKDGSKNSFKKPPQNDTAIDKLVFLVDLINEILNEGLSDKENEVLSNIGAAQKNKFNEENITQDLLGLVFNNIMYNNRFDSDLESGDVNIGKESGENNINPYLLTNNNQTSSKDANSYFLSKEIDDTEELSLFGLKTDFNPMENKWHKIVNESLKEMEFDNQKDLKTVEPVIYDIINKHFKLNKTFHHKKKENNTVRGIDKGYLKSKSLSNSTGKSMNITKSNVNHFSDVIDNNIAIDTFDDMNANSSRHIVNPNYRRRLKISASEINEYRRNVNDLNKLKGHERSHARRNFEDEDPNYNEDDYYWVPTPQLTRRIYQGTPVRITDFPFMASIHMFETLQCAGAIIKSDLVLTAASCLQIAWNNRFFRENPRFLTVRVGTTRFYGGGEVIEVAEVYFHPHYKPKSLTANLAIIRLYRNIRFSNVTTQYVVKIHYDREEHRVPDNNGPVTLIGFGAVRASNKLHAKGFGKLQYAILPIYPYGDCRDMYSREYVTKQNFCAGLMARGSGACNHDVGDPGISDGYILGIVSFGSPICGRIDTPTVFTKVGLFRDWIDEIYKIEPVVYLHRYSTTPDPVPLEPIEPKTTRRYNTNITKKVPGRNMGLAKAKLSFDDRTKSPFKVRPMTKNVDVLEYFPADDPMKMGRTKKRKLRMRPEPKRVIAQQGQITVPGASNPQASVPYGISKLAFGMAQPTLAAQNPQLGNQQPPVMGQQQAAVGLQQRPRVETQQLLGVAPQQKPGLRFQQQPGVGLSPQSGASRQFAQHADAIPTEGTTILSNHEFLPDECSESDFEGTGPNAEHCKVSSAAAARAGNITTPVDLNAQHIKVDKKKTRVYPEVPGLKLVHVNSEAIDDENKVSSLIESIFAPAMQPDIHHATDNNADNQQDGPQKLKEIDKSIMSMLYVSDKEKKEKAKLNDNDNNDSGFKDYKVPRGEGLALPGYVEGLELDEPNEFKFRSRDTDIDKNRNSNIPVNEAMIGADNLPNKDVGGEEQHEIGFEAADDSNEHRNSNNNAGQDIGGDNSPTDQTIVNNPDNQAVTNEGSDNFNFDSYLASLFSPDQLQDAGATMADEVTNIPRYREDTDPPEGYLDQ